MIVHTYVHTFTCGYRGEGKARTACGKPWHLTKFQMVVLSRPALRVALHAPSPTFARPPTLAGWLTCLRHLQRTTRCNRSSGSSPDGTVTAMDRWSMTPRKDPTPSYVGARHSRDVGSQRLLVSRKRRETSAVTSARLVGRSTAPSYCPPANPRPGWRPTLPEPGPGGTPKNTKK